MKNTKKAFTLVELIVVITILAVLATVAFISLTGHAQDAKNTKVNSDVALLAKTIDSAITQSIVSTKNIISTNIASHNVDPTDDVTKTEKTGTSSVDLTIANGYETGLVDFGAIQQSGDDFKDASGKAYIAGAVSSGSLSKYQIAGQVKEASGDIKMVVKGNYVAITSGDTEGLISQSGSTLLDPVKSEEGLENTTLDLYGATVN
ncbi:MAG: type II secretion system protein [Candidatus Gracilibacteria bacterium]|nr:type II secretion system protein [Candidatus Gracilibacteria bacterium]